LGAVRRLGHKGASMIDNDPLWRLRHALIGMAAALMLSVLIAALAGSWIADLFAEVINKVYNYQSISSHFII